MNIERGKRRNRIKASASVSTNFMRSVQDRTDLQCAGELTTEIFVILFMRSISSCFNEQSSARTAPKEETKKRGASERRGCTLEISGCMTSLAHLAGGYEVGSCAVLQLAPRGQPSVAALSRAQLSSFTIMYGRPLRTVPSGGLAKSR